MIVDPLTGDVQYTNEPKPGAGRMNTSDTLSEIPQSKNFRSAPPTKASFRERSLQLKSGMSAPEVARLLGMPIRTESSTYGSATKKPWNGVSWKYTSPDGQLKVVFQTVDGKLYVNNWSW